MTNQTGSGKLGNHKKKHGAIGNLADRPNPKLLVECSHSCRIIFQRRGLLLRSLRARRVIVLQKSGPRSWLEVELPNEKGENEGNIWDLAHKLSAAFHKDMRQKAYVEPVSIKGRYWQLFVRPVEDARATVARHNTVAGKPSRAGASNGAFDLPGLASVGMPDIAGMPSMSRLPDGVGGPGLAGAGPAFGSGPGFGSGAATGGFADGLPDFSNLMPEIPGFVRSAEGSYLPEDLAQQLSQAQPAEEAKLDFPPLRDFDSYAELSEPTRQMLEAEAAQASSRLLPGAEAAFAESGLCDSLLASSELSRALRSLLENGAG